MTDDNNCKYQDSAEKPLPGDNLNAKIGVLIRRETEARILAPLIDALAETFGKDAVLTVVKSTIVEIAREQGKELSRQMGGNSLKHFVESLKYWTMDDALEIDMIEKSENVLSFDVGRCRYAELYESLGIRELGATLSCTRDFALIEGFNSDVRLTRSQTIMEGAPYCDFRYRLKKL
jgi:predicted hydrocarbon binding protein